MLQILRAAILHKSAAQTNNQKQMKIHFIYQQTVAISYLICNIFKVRNINVKKQTVHFLY